MGFVIHVPWIKVHASFRGSCRKFGAPLILNLRLTLHNMGLVSNSKVNAKTLWNSRKCNISTQPSPEKYYSKLFAISAVAWLRFFNGRGGGGGRGKARERSDRARDGVGVPPPTVGRFLKFVYQNLHFARRGICFLYSGFSYTIHYFFLLSDQRGVAPCAPS